jgi:hypothetical protein
MGAVQSEKRSQREIVRMRCEAILAAEERWRAAVIEDMKRAPSDPQAMPRINGLAQLKSIEARMAAVRKELAAP